VRGKFVARGKTRLKSLLREGKTHRSGKTQNILFAVTQGMSFRRKPFARTKPYVQI